MQDTQVSLRKAAALFRSLPAADIALPPGDYRASMTGPVWLQRASRPMLSSIGFSNWYGKRVRENGDAINLREQDGDFIEFLPMHLAIEPSRLDDKAAWVLRYPETTHLPVRHMVDELRRLDASHLLGMSYTELFGLGKLGLPFLLHIEL